jgi:hypothetical protein
MGDSTLLWDDPVSGVCVRRACMVFVCIFSFMTGQGFYQFFAQYRIGLCRFSSVFSSFYFLN